MSHGKFSSDGATMYQDLLGRHKLLTTQIRHLTELQNAVIMLRGAIGERKTITLTLTDSRQWVAATIDFGETTLFEMVPWELFSKWILPMLCHSRNRTSLDNRLLRHLSVEIIPQ